jgi:multiple sugar transport system permease protein
VTFPLLTPSLFFVLITGVIGSFQVFTQVFVITLGGGGPNDSTRVFMLHLYDNAFENLRMGYASALAWVLFVVILVFTLLQFQLNKKVYYEAEVR